ncbi:MAG: radical SAM protein [Planctomycetaceae bacterium]|nr:radical SAM protein [Planctomycetaceae bacterium]
MSFPLSLSRIFYPVTTLGPGRRIGIWFQGCSIRCPGCISADTWSQKESDVTVEEVLSSLDPLLADADGVTISGGEPFEQFAALGMLLIGIRQKLSPGKDILVYSGYTINELGGRMQEIQGLIDALISGPYVADALQTRPLMGSDNQELHLLTTLGRTNFKQFLRDRLAADDKFDLLMDDDGTAWMAGIPKPGDFEKLRSALAERGVTFQTTEDRHSRS